MTLFKKILNKQLKKMENFNTTSKNTPTININSDEDFSNSKERINKLRATIRNTTQ
ncbi:hypothetical protein [Clostridium perfringens]|uniref:Uncharacterized protein n=1 Tax=Clostridium perfringens TaxID=1502 RepID=A0A2X3C105_CLOPF|nr:hypothetical protein [Clostridium perfringens]ELC8344253.1 hypothetical protein [Clostridium perfringens]MBO3435960.1 hypothetical protein [Clostridium perfringens]MDK0856805.1 hypothetical protein [Clostridium perfringens]MDU6982712.1 hypothetical protein [Clostridium perfringens]SQC06711.1 Uncharacterised protein [Clostridium perfringens]